MPTGMTYYKKQLVLFTTRLCCFYSPFHTQTFADAERSATKDDTRRNSCDT